MTVNQSDSPLPAVSSGENDSSGLNEVPAAVRYDLQLRTELNPPSPLVDVEYAATLRRLHDVLRQVGPTAAAEQSPGLQPPTVSCDGAAEFSRSVELETTALQEARLVLSGRFSVLRLLGQGSFGRVFLASDGILHRDVAIKIPHRSAIGNAELKARFLRESRAAARLNHPNIVRVLDSGESDGVSWQVAEFVDGPNLGEYRRQQQSSMAVKDTVSLMMQLADAVQHAHENGVLHRDIKPENVLLTPLSLKSNSSDSVKLSTEQAASDAVVMKPCLTDFGLARLIDEEVGISRSGLLIGTPKYMAPEQLTGRSSAQGPWTDIYSMGVLLHELLTGAVPFAEADSLPTRAIVTAQPVPAMRRLNSEIPRDVETICLKCLNSRPEDRYQSAAGLRDDLRRFLEGRPTLARPLPLHEQFLRWADRNRVLALLLSLFLISVMVVFAQVVGRHRATREQNQNLAMALNQLTEEKDRADSLVKLAESHRVDAEQNEFRFRELAWNSSIRETFQAMGQNRLHAAWEILNTLQSSHPEFATRPEWQLASQELAARYQVIFEAEHALNAVVAIPSTRLLAAAGESYEVEIIDTVTHRPVKTIQTDIHSIHALAVTRDGKRLAVGGRTNSKAIDEALPAIYSLETGELLQTLSGHPTTIDAMVFSPDGTRLIVGSRYEPVRIYDLVKGVESVLQTERKNDWLAVTEDGAEVMALAKNDTVVIAPLERPSEARLIKATREISLVVQLPGTRVIACNEYHNRAVQLIHMDTGVQVGRLVLTGKSSSFLSVSSPPHRLFVGRVDGNVAMFDIPKDWLDSQAVTASDGEKLSSRELFASEVVMLESETLRDSTFTDAVLYCCSESGRVLRYGFHRKWQSTHEWDTNDGLWRSAAILHTGDVFVGSIYGDVLRVPGRVRESQARTGRSIEQVAHDATSADWVWSQGPGAFLGLAVSADQTQMAVFNDLCEVYLKTTGTKEPIVRSVWKAADVHDVHDLCFSPDMRQLAWVSSDDMLSRVDLESPTGTRQKALGGDGFVVQYSPDSRFLAAGGSMAELNFFDSETLDVVAALDDCVDCRIIEWDEAEKTLLLGFVNGYIQIRSLLDKQVSHKKMIHQQDVAGIVILPNSDLAVSVDRTAQVAIWNRRTLTLVGFLFEPPARPDAVRPMRPQIRIVDSGELVLVFDDGLNGLQIVRWNLNGKDFKSREIPGFPVIEGAASVDLGK